MSGSLLVTGASGLIGRHLLPALAAEGFSPLGLSRAPGGLGPHHRTCDLSRAEEASQALAELRPRAVVHLAGGAHPDRHELYRRNVLATVNLMTAVARLASRPYVILFGSAAEFGDAEDLIDEAAPLRPVTDYGRAKLAGTTLAEGLAETAGIALTVLRPFNVVAPDLPQSAPLGALRHQLLAGGARPRVVCGRLDVVRDFVPVALVVDTVRALLATPCPGSLNVCTGVGIPLGDVVAAAAARLGVEPQLVEDPRLVGLPAAGRVVGDPSRLAELLGRSLGVTPDDVAAALLGAAG